VAHVSAGPLIEVEKLTRVFGAREQKVAILNDLSFCVPAGSLFADQVEHRAITFGEIVPGPVEGSPQTRRKPKLSTRVGRFHLLSVERQESHL
jgi:hypothetical protein